MLQLWLNSPENDYLRDTLVMYGMKPEKKKKKPTTFFKVQIQEFLILSLFSKTLKTEMKFQVEMVNSKFVSV